MQIPILNGVYVDEVSDYRSLYPRNLMPIPVDNGISAGYLKQADGIVQFGTTSGLDRGGINWNGACYRVAGENLIEVHSDGTNTTIGSVGNDYKNVTLTYSFDRLAIASNNNLFYYDSDNGLVQVTDEDLGNVTDVTWVDGYFMTTDGEYLVVTDLTDPTAINPLKYGSSEAAPDPVIALEKLKNEVYALNRYTIEVFDNVGTSGFPFQRIESAQIERGAIGTHATAIFMESIAFLGSGENESPSIWLASNSSSVRVASREIDKLLEDYTELELSDVVLESRVDKGHELLYVHLKEKTLVYDGGSSRALNTPVWFILDSTVRGNTYQARNFVWCYDKWICGDPTDNQYGYLTDTVSTHYGEKTSWEFGNKIVYNNSMGAIFHSLELVTVTGNVVLGADPTDRDWETHGKIRTGNRSIK